MRLERIHTHCSCKFSLYSHLQYLCFSDLVIVVGGVIPAQDYEFLYETGVHLVFGPGTKVTDAAIQVVDCIDSLLPDNEATG